MNGRQVLDDVARSQGLTYAQALAVWHHRLDTRRRDNLARIRQVAAVTVRSRVGDPER